MTPFIPTEALDLLPAQWLAQAGARAVAHLDAGRWKPDSADRAAAAAVRDFLQGDEPGPTPELTESRIHQLSEASTTMARCVDADAMTPLLAELLLAFARALLPWRPPRRRSVWEPPAASAPYEPGSIGALTRMTKDVRAAGVQLLDRIATLPADADGESAVPEILGRSGIATRVQIYQDDGVLSSVLTVSCPSCGEVGRLLIATDWRRLDLTCPRGHRWTDHRITVSAWTLDPLGENLGDAPPGGGLHELGEVRLSLIS
ncbi:hypothetical protein ACFWNG_05515 [Streptomyces sp. NPDC058391]|uniref:hypothetical protein n=1 Tax=Streptomyces sp. NPDC058391 TaxID=3346476 RepID=UPI00365564DA